MRRVGKCHTPRVDATESVSQAASQWHTATKCSMIGGRDGLWAQGGLGAATYTACRSHPKKKLSSLCRTSSAALFQSADPIFLQSRKRRRNKLEKRLLRPLQQSVQSGVGGCVRLSVAICCNCVCGTRFNWAQTETKQAASWVLRAIYSERALQRSCCSTVLGLSARLKIIIKIIIII